MLWPAVGADRQTISQLLRGQVAKQGLGRFLRPTLLVSMSGWRLDVPRHPSQIKTHLAIFEQGFASSLVLIHSLGVITLLTLPRLVWARERDHPLLEAESNSKPHSWSNSQLHIFISPPCQRLLSFSYPSPSLLSDHLKYPKFHLFC